MKNLPLKVLVLYAVIIIFVLYFSPSFLYSQGMDFYEQDGFSTHDKTKLANFYWQLSQELFKQKQFDEAIFQVQRVYEFSPNDDRVASFIESVKSARDSNKSSKQRMYRAFIDREQEDYTGGSVDTYLPMPAEVSPAYGPQIRLPQHVEKSIEKMIKRARVSYQNKNYNDALYYLNEVLVMDSSNREALNLKNRIVKEKSFVRTKELPSAPKRPDERVAQAMVNAQKEYKRRNYDAALFYLNAVLIWHPQNEEALSLKNIILNERRSKYESVYERERKQKAEAFRDREETGDISPPQESMADIKEYERMRLKIQEERYKEEEKRNRLAEARIREDVRRRIELQEKEDLELLIQEVEESKFYEKFQSYEEEKEQKKRMQKRQIHSFLLRAEGLMEMGKYEEAAVYLNNVFMVEPYNERAQKMRVKLEQELVDKKIRERREYDKLFEEEKKEYKKIRENVRKEKIRTLLNEADRLYDEDDLLTARQEYQKVIIVDPSNRHAKRFLKKIDKKLLTLQEEMRAQEELREERRAQAMEESFQEAARALEIELIKEKKEDLSIQERIRVFLAQADHKAEIEHDYDGALVDLNRAYAIDPGNKKVMDKIKKVRALKARRIDHPEKEIHEILTRESDKSEKSISIAVDREEEKKAKEQKWEELKRGKQILGAAARRSYQGKVEEYVSNAQRYLEQKQFDKARSEVERIFLFDKNNPTAKDLLARITEYEISYEKKMEEKSLDQEFETGLELEKLKVEMQRRAEGKVIREPQEAKIEDKKIQEKTIKKLIKEGKSLYKKERYYEALNKFEAIFAIDAQNEEASRYVDKIKETMLKEREEERKRIREKQREEINEKLNEYSSQIQSLHKQGRYTEAAILIEKGLLLDPTSKYLKELKKLNQRGSDEKMRLNLSDEEKVKDLINIAIKEFIQGNYLESRKYFEKVLEISPDDEKAKNSIAKIDKKVKELGL